MTQHLLVKSHKCLEDISIDHSYSHVGDTLLETAVRMA